MAFIELNLETKNENQKNHIKKAHENALSETSLQDYISALEKQLNGFLVYCGGSHIAIIEPLKRTRLAIVTGSCFK